MDIQEIRNNIELLPDAIHSLEKFYLEEKAQLEYMNDLTKHLLAKWKGRFLGSNAEKDRLAMALPEYETHLSGICEQTKIVADKAAAFHLEERRFEAMRSLNKNI
jgi:hypothetical protein